MNHQLKAKRINMTDGRIYIIYATPVEMVQSEHAKKLMINPQA